jgi:hypothetical protein
VNGRVSVLCASANSLKDARVGVLAYVCGVNRVAGGTTPIFESAAKSVFACTQFKFVDAPQLLAQALLKSA